MKQAFIIFFLFTLITACRKVECEDFDFSHEVVNWHLFPDRQLDYDFQFDSLSVTLTQTGLNISEYEEYRCHMCACFRDFIATYTNDSLHFGSIVFYNSINDADQPTIQYQIGNENVSFNLTNSGNIIAQSSDGTPYNDNISFSIHDTLTLSTTLYENVLDIEFLAEIQTKKIWVAKGHGLIGFEQNGVVYTKN